MTTYEPLPESLRIQASEIDGHGLFTLKFLKQDKDPFDNPVPIILNSALYIFLSVGNWASSISIICLILALSFLILYGCLLSIVNLVTSPILSKNLDEPPPNPQLQQWNKF